MTTYLDKSYSFCLPRVPFVKCRQFMYLVSSLLVLRAGYGIWLYQFLIIAYLFTYDYPSWRTGGSPFVSQVPGYLKTHIIYSFLTILNYKTACACRSSIMFLISLRRLNFHNAPLVRKHQWKEVFSLHGSQVERGYITMRQTTSRTVTYACCLQRRKVEQLKSW